MRCYAVPSTMEPLELVNLTSLMEVTRGRPEMVIGLIDGPVTVDHPGLTVDRIGQVPGKRQGVCTVKSSIACTHGTFVAGILSAKRGSDAPGISPECTLLVCPIFAEASDSNVLPSATSEELSDAIFATIDAGARIINLSAALIQPSAKGKTDLKESLDYALRRGVIVIAAAGNQGNIGSTVITSHPWVIPVVACNQQGQPLSYSNLGASIGAHGLSAPGENITSLGTDGKPFTFSGTSAAAPFVTGATALLWSEFPDATAGEVKLAVARTHAPRRRMIVPPLMDATKAYELMAIYHGRRQIG